MRPGMGGAALVLRRSGVRDHVAGAPWFKADALSAAALENAGCAPFRYTRKDGREVTTRYRHAPDAAHDDADALSE